MRFHERLEKTWTTLTKNSLKLNQGLLHEFSFKAIILSFCFVKQHERVVEVTNECERHERAYIFSECIFGLKNIEKQQQHNIKCLTIFLKVDICQTSQVVYFVYGAKFIAISHPLRGLRFFQQQTTCNTYFKYFLILGIHTNLHLFIYNNFCFFSALN